MLIDGLDIHEGMFLTIDKKIYKVISCTYGGTAKSHRIAHVGLKSIPEGSFAEKTFNPGQKVESIHPEKNHLQFLYKDKDSFYFMNLANYEQLAVPASLVGNAGLYLKENVEIVVDFFEGQPINIVFPSAIELKVTLCAPGIKGGQESTMKEAVLENGQKTLVPQFIKEGDLIRVDVETGKYVDRKKEATGQ